jgi:hypothetical protein
VPWWILNEDASLEEERMVLSRLDMVLLYTFQGYAKEVGRGCSHYIPHGVHAAVSTSSNDIHSREG